MPCKVPACLGWAGGHLHAEGKVMDQAGPWVWAEVPSLLLSVAPSPRTTRPSAGAPPRDQTFQPPLALHGAVCQNQ